MTPPNSPHHADPIASVIRERLQIGRTRPTVYPTQETREVAFHFADTIAKHDKAFSRVQFLESCGVL